MDGTLTVPNLDFAEMYDRCGVDRSGDILRAIVAMPPEQAAKANQIVEEMEEEGRRTLQLMPGAVSMLQWLAYHQIPTALVTRNTYASTQRLLELLQEADPRLPPFEPIISRDFEPTLPPKPDAAALEHIAKVWDIELSEDIVMVGDSPANDIVFGKNAGVSTALLWQRKPTVFQASERADITICHIAQLPKQLYEQYNLETAAKYPEPMAEPKPMSDAAKAAYTGDFGAIQSIPVEHLFLTDKDNNTPLIWASEAGHDHVVNCILDKIASEIGNNDKSKHATAYSYINLRGYRGATALSRAVRQGHQAVLKALLKHPIAQANVNLPNCKQQYPLHIAAFRQHHSIVEILLEAGADPHVVDHKGRTPREDTKCPKIKEMLESAAES